jgi:hypothetical protein
VADNHETTTGHTAATAGRIVDEQEPGDAPRDIRQDAADEPNRDDGHDPEQVRVPSSDEITESVRRAQRALAELKQRQAIEQRRAADEAHNVTTNSPSGAPTGATRTSQTNPCKTPQPTTAMQTTCSAAPVPPMTSYRYWN